MNCTLVKTGCAGAFFGVKEKAWDARGTSTTENSFEDVLNNLLFKYDFKAISPAQGERYYVKIKDDE